MAGGRRRRSAPAARIRAGTLLSAASWGDVRDARSVAVSPELARRSVPLDRLAEVLSERAFAAADRDLPDGPSCVRAAFGAPVGGGDGGGRVLLHQPVLRRCGARRRSVDASLLAACWETADLARRHADHVALAHHQLRALAPVGTGRSAAAGGLQGWFRRAADTLVRRGSAAPGSGSSFLRPSRALVGRLVRGGLMALGVVAGVRWALPLPGVEGRCPPSGEGFGYCYLQKSVLPAVMLLLAPVLGAQLVGSFVTRTAPDLRRRWKAGERPTRITQRQAAAPYAEDPVLLAASWGVRTGEDASDR